MIRAVSLLLLFFAGPVWAEPAGLRELDTERLLSVYAEALTFVAPRTLEPLSVPRLALFGLQGLTSLDPALQVTSNEGRLRLSRRGQVLADLPEPREVPPEAQRDPDRGPSRDPAAAAWARSAASLTESAYAQSPALRRAGTQGVIQCFFDEMFSHVDSYSRYVPPIEAGADRATRAGKAGLGLVVGQRGRLIEVRSVVRDSPAAIAGIKPGEILFAIDGQRTEDQDPATIASLLSGAENSAVTLSLRGRDGRIREVDLVRVMVPPETVFAQRLADVLVLRITSFSNSTASHIALSVQDAMSETHPVNGIVLDLRDNRGGLLRQAVTAADTFLPAGLVAVTTGRDPDANHIWRSAEGELAENVPLVILVDGRTASAAEILAGALSDRGRAVVVGSSTLGKGLVQTIDPLPDGGELFVTWSRLLTPLGWPVQGIGVLPQVCTSLGPEALGREMAALSLGFQPMADALRRHNAARVPVPATEELAIRAYCPAAEAKPADLDAARTLIANPAAYAAALPPPIPQR